MVRTGLSWSTVASALLREAERTEYGFPLRHRNPMVVRHLNPAAIGGAQLGGIFARVAQPAGHGNVDNFIEALRKNAVPQFHDLSGRRLCGENSSVLPHGVVEVGAVHVLALQVRLSFDVHGHRQEVQPRFTDLRTGDFAVHIRRNRRHSALSVPEKSAKSGAPHFLRRIELPIVAGFLAVSVI